MSLILSQLLVLVPPVFPAVLRWKNKTETSSLQTDQIWTVMCSRLLYAWGPWLEVPAIKFFVGPHPKCLNIWSRSWLSHVVQVFSAFHETLPSSAVRSGFKEFLRFDFANSAMFNDVTDQVLTPRTTGARIWCREDDREQEETSCVAFKVTSVADSGNKLVIKAECHNLSADNLRIEVSVFCCFEIGNKILISLLLMVL